MLEINYFSFLKSQQLHFKGLSFTAVSAVGAHAAMAHYTPSLDTDKRITRDEIYLVDSGGQYLGNFFFIIYCNSQYDFY